MTYKINFYKCLKQKKVLVFYCVQKGGLFTYSGDPKPIASNTPCTADFSNQWRVKYTTPSYISLYWNDDFNNGVINIQLDEYFNGKWNRTLVCGYVFSDNIVINEIDGIDGNIYINECGRISLQRKRDDFTNVLPNKEGLQMGSDFLKFVSVSKRNSELGCKV